MVEEKSGIHLSGVAGFGCQRWFWVQLSRVGLG